MQSGVNAIKRTGDYLVPYMAPYLMNHYLRKYLIKGERGCSGILFRLDKGLVYHPAHRRNDVE